MALSSRDAFMDRFGKLPAVSCSFRKLSEALSRNHPLSEQLLAVLRCATVDSPGVASSEFTLGAAQFWRMAEQSVDGDHGNDGNDELMACIRMLSALRSASSKSGEQARVSRRVDVQLLTSPK